MNRIATRRWTRLLSKPYSLSCREWPTRRLPGLTRSVTEGRPVTKFVNQSTGIVRGTPMYTRERIERISEGGMKKRSYLSDEEILGAAAVSLVGLAIVLAAVWVMVLLVAQLSREFF